MKYKRRKLNLQVNRRLQIWLLVRILGVIFVTSTITGIILYVYANKKLADSFFDVHMQIQRLSDLLVPIILSGVGLSLFCGLVVALFLPQKIAGPLFRIEMELKAIRAGDLSRKIKLRKDDPLQELAHDINATVSSLVNRIEHDS